MTLVSGGQGYVVVYPPCTLQRPRRPASRSESSPEGTSGTLFSRSAGASYGPLSVPFSSFYIYKKRSTRVPISRGRVVLGLDRVRRFVPSCSPC